MNYGRRKIKYVDARLVFITANDAATEFLKQKKFTVGGTAIMGLYEKI